MSNARNLSKFKPSSSGLVETADIANDAVDTDQIANDAVGTAQLANDVAINTSSYIRTTGAFTSVGIDDNADATAITIDSSENVGIGTTTPATQLEISGTSANTQGGAFPRIQISTTGNSNPTYSGSLDIVEKQSSASSTAVFGTSAIYGFRMMLDGNANVLKWFSGSSATVTERMGLARDSGDLTLNTGNLIIGTAGKGIDFSAVTHATGKTSELLDAYEEGTWTPTYRTADGSSITVNTYNRQHGRYTRIGRNVFCRFAIGTTSVTFNNGQVDHNSNHRVQMDGLPFTSSNDSINGGTCSGVFSSMGSVSTGVGFLINNNSTIISLRNMGDTGSYNGNFIDDIYTAQMRSHSSGEGNMLTGQFFYQTE